MDREDLSRPPLPTDFSQAAAPAVDRVIVPLGLDADILAYFQSQGEPGDWQGHINGILRFYMETNQNIEAAAEAVARTIERTDEPAP
jgi:hypothetical protein